ncbi:MAG: TraR/DksA family transcriptional regulator [Bryobacteraceae bacterium]|nr:TraR/DksA family transcriptional regulator [Bryobacteraceae bacterium]
MTRESDTMKYRALLETKLAELLQAVRKREDITIEKAADALDDLQLAALRELAITNLNRESRLLRAVRGALARFKDGSYGVCLHCEEPISPKRLNAVPWAAYCVRCQEAVDRGEMIEERHDADDFDLMDAA